MTLEIKIKTKYSCNVWAKMESKNGETKEVRLCLNCTGEDGDHYEVLSAPVHEESKPVEPQKKVSITDTKMQPEALHKCVHKYKEPVPVRILDEPAQRKPNRVSVKVMQFVIICSMFLSVYLDTHITS